jgi:hypothetical protein
MQYVVDYILYNLPRYILYTIHIKHIYSSLGNNSKQHRGRILADFWYYTPPLHRLSSPTLIQCTDIQLILYLLTPYTSSSLPLPSTLTHSPPWILHGQPPTTGTFRHQLKRPPDPSFYPPSSPFPTPQPLNDQCNSLHKASQCHSQQMDSDGQLESMMLVRALHGKSGSLLHAVQPART